MKNIVLFFSVHDGATERKAKVDYFADIYKRQHYNLFCLRTYLSLPCDNLFLGESLQTVLYHNIFQFKGLRSVQCHFLL